MDHEGVGLAVRRVPGQGAAVSPWGFCFDIHNGQGRIKGRRSGACVPDRLPEFLEKLKVRYSLLGGLCNQFPTQNPIFSLSFTNFNLGVVVLR